MNSWRRSIKNGKPWSFPHFTVEKERLVGYHAILRCSDNFEHLHSWLREFRFPLEEGGKWRTIGFQPTGLFFKCSDRHQHELFGFLKLSVVGESRTCFGTDKDLGGGQEREEERRLVSAKADAELSSIPVSSYLHHPLCFIILGKSFTAIQLVGFQNSWGFKHTSHTS